VAYIVEFSHQSSTSPVNVYCVHSMLEREAHDEGSVLSGSLLHGGRCATPDTVFSTLEILEGMDRE